MAVAYDRAFSSSDRINVPSKSNIKALITIALFLLNGMNTTRLPRACS